ncbi:MAG: monofunctional biosynthetic peptidoglycan transglycosylase [Gemmatimonadales bacterium]|jgi:monofunctional biosynthetic peptidoglycan transglycosylase
MAEECDSSQETDEQRDPLPQRGAGGARRSKKRLGVAAAMGIATMVALSAAYNALTWPDVSALERSNPETTAFIERYRARAENRGDTSDIHWVWVPYDSISPHLKCAVLVAEDIGFFSHRGFEGSEIKQAIGDALSGERALRGASTITQQLAKNLWLSPSRSLLRKLKEAALAYHLEQRLSKKRILEIYLNVVEFGPGVYGAEAAARYYFRKAATDLNPKEAAQLAAALPRPLRWNPASDNRWYRQYTTTIQERMDQAAFLWRRI